MNNLGVKNFTHKTLLCLFAYAAIRCVSYIFPPDTPLHGASIFNTIVAAVAVAVVGYLLVKKNMWGWYLVAGEIILGGAGNFFALYGISLRTCLLFVSLGIFFVQQIGSYRHIVATNRIFVYLLSFLYLVVGLAALRGYLNGHGLGAVFADTIPYLFFLYVFPLRQALQQESQKCNILACSALAAAIIGNTIFMAMTLAGFSSGLLVLQDGFYHWFRDVAGGKITELPLHFYRIVLNEQLLLIPILVWLFNSLLNKVGQKKLYLALTTCLLIVLSINLTRSYLLALGVGCLLLFRPKIWKRWIVGGVLLLVSFITIFIGVHLAATRGQSLGLEIFGLRLQSIVTPSLEQSSLSRLLLLPKITEKIKMSPILGEGLADTVTVYSPVLKKEITTSQFDWGYLEIWAELGLIGLLAWGLFVLYLMYNFKQLRFVPAWQLASVAALLVITLTSPALFHVLGIIWLTILLAKNTTHEIPAIL